MNPREKAQQGLHLLEEAILELLVENPKGLRNAEIAERLNVRSDYKGGNKDYLSWSVLGLLMNQNKIERYKNRYYLFGQAPQGNADS